MLGDVIALCAVRIVVPAPEELAQYGIVWFLDAARFDVPACEVVLQHADEALFGVVACFGTEYFIL